MEKQFEGKGKSNPKIISLMDDSVLKFKKNKKDLAEYDTYVRFVNAVKHMVRQDLRYVNYKKACYDMGLDRCQFHANLTSEMCPIELHHGPIFSLFDVCAIVTDQLLHDEDEINTFMVADKVLTYHENHSIQFTMLCETCHEAAENKSIFIAYEQGFGQLDKFIKSNKKGISAEIKSVVKDYLKASKAHGAVDNKIYEIFDRVKKYEKKN